MLLNRDPLPAPRRRLRRARALVFAAALLLGAARAVDLPLEDFTALSLEELDSLSISAASKRAQPLFETPAAVSVLLPVDLRRSGHSSVAESMRLAPGAHVTQQFPGRWGIGIRGFNGFNSSKLLVLVDGRSVYSPYYGSVDWIDADVPIEDVARVEIVRGPGATLWGANAVNGIVNVVSKDPRETLGSLLSARLGTGEAAQLYARHGGSLGEKTWYRFSAQHREGSWALGAAADDPATLAQTRLNFQTLSTLSAHWDLTWQADHLDSRRGLSPGELKHRLSHLATRLEGREVLSGEFRAQLYYDHSHYRPEGRPALAGLLNETVSNLDLDLTHHFKWGSRQDVIWGGGARVTTSDFNGNDTASLAEPKRTQTLYNLFLQDEITVLPGWRLTLGSKVEHYSNAGWQVLPSARVAWLPRKDHTFWAAASRAVRAPSRSEQEANVAVFTVPARPGTPALRTEVYSNPDFAEEVNVAGEFGWRWRPAPRFQTDFTAYHFEYDKLRTLSREASFSPGPPPTVTQRLTPVNAGASTAYGAELAANWRVRERWELGAAVARGRTSAQNDFPEFSFDPDYAVPDWLWHVRSWWQLARDWEFSTALYGVGETSSRNQPGYLRLDLQLVWCPRPDLELAAGVQNAGDPSHPEVIDSGLGVFREVRRNVYLRAQWRF